MGSLRRALVRIWVVAPVALAVLAFVSHDDRTGSVDIGSALQVIDRSQAALRSAEEITYDDADLELLGVYVVADGALLDAADAPPEHHRAWDVATRILPAVELAQIRQLNVVTDGPAGTLAMVHRSGVAADQWVLSIDAAEPTRVLEETLVHELAHLLTLRSTDLTTTGPCDGVQLEIGCARAGSALAQWADAFWTDPTDAMAHDPDLHVSTYAATSVHEDFAETFLAYVTGDHPTDAPTIQAKLAFFDTRPELVAAANQVRPRINVG